MQPTPSRPSGGSPTTVLGSELSPVDVARIGLAWCIATFLQLVIGVGWVVVP